METFIPMLKSRYMFRPLVPNEIEMLKTIMRGVEWPEHYVGVHAEASEKLINDDEGEVFVATDNDNIVGFINLRHQKLNWLTCVYTLVVDKPYHRKGVGKALLELAEQRARDRGNRGLFLDTTEQNTNARTFYKSVGLQEAYFMPSYYSDELDGRTYIKLFNKRI
jgi:ribosomal protein S18 acetylase RimI-like enzyme